MRNTYTPFSLFTSALLLLGSCTGATMQPLGMDNGDHQESKTALLGATAKEERSISVEKQEMYSRQLIGAVVQPNTQDLQPLLEKATAEGVNLSYTSLKFPKTPLHIAAMFGKVEAVKLLLNHKAAPDQVNYVEEDEENDALSPIECACFLPAPQINETDLAGVVRL